jgi:NitT/TauT family transport system substrate-binding protein
VLKTRLAGVALLLIAIVAGTAGAATSKGEQQLTQVKLAYAPITDYAPIFVGLKLGYWKKEGIELKTNSANITPSSLVAASISGQVDVATNSATALITAVVQGIPCKLIAAGSEYPTKGYMEILVRANSDIRRFRDLEGKNVATVGLRGLFHMATLNAVEKDGGDWTKVTALPIAQQDGAPALMAGRVDAVVLQEPFTTLAKLQSGIRSIGNPLALFDPRTTAGVMIACGDIFDKKKDLLNRFLRAWKRSVDFAQAHPKFTRTIIPKYSGLSQQVANLITVPTFTTRLPAAVLGKMIKTMTHYGWITGTPPDYNKLVWDRK